MQQLTFIKPHRLEWQDVPPPGLSCDTDALVRPDRSSRAAPSRRC